MNGMHGALHPQVGAWNEMNQQEWMLLPGVCETAGAEGVATYGVCVSHTDGRWVWSDVDPDPAVVQRLVARLNEAQPEPCHFVDMVLDFIEEQAASF